MNSNKIKIFKRNEVARGSDLYSLNGKKCFNALYYLYQKNRDTISEYKKQSNSSKIRFKYASIRKAMGLENNDSYVDIINDSIKELRDTSIQLNNVKIDNTTYKWYVTSFILKYGIEKEDKIYVNIEFEELFEKLIVKNLENFTMLELIPYLNKLRTKYSMKLYEYLKSFEKNPNTWKYIDISQDQMLLILGLDKEPKNYKHYANLKMLVSRSLGSISEKTDLYNVQLITESDLSKQKIYRIQILSRKIDRKKMIEALR